MKISLARTGKIVEDEDSLIEKLRWKIIAICCFLIIISLLLDVAIFHLQLKEPYSGIFKEASFLMLFTGMTGFLYEVFVRVDTILLVDNRLTRILMSEKYVTLDKHLKEKLLLSSLRMHLDEKVANDFYEKILSATFQQSKELRRTTFDQIAEILEVRSINSKNIYKIGVINQFEIENTIDMSIKIYPDNCFLFHFVIDEEKYNKAIESKKYNPERWLWTEKTNHLSDMLKLKEIRVEEIFELQNFEVQVFDKKEKKFIKMHAKPRITTDKEEWGIICEIKFSTKVPPRSKIKIIYSVIFLSAEDSYRFNAKRVTTEKTKITFLHSKLIDGVGKPKDVYFRYFFWSGKKIVPQTYGDKKIIEVNGLVLPGDAVIFYLEP
jgi:hypothetical protein